MSKQGMIGSIGEFSSFTQTGVVAGNQSLAEVAVSTYSSGGNQSGTSVSVTSSEQLRLFVRQDDGREFEASFSDPGFGVMEGHRVTVVYGGTASHGYPMGLVNHNTGKRAAFPKVIDDIIRKPSMMVGCVSLIVAPLVIYLVLSLVAMSTGLFWDHDYQRPSGTLFLLTFLGFAGVVAWLVKRTMDRNALAAAVQTAVHAKLEEAVAKEGKA